MSKSFGPSVRLGPISIRGLVSSQGLILGRGMHGTITVVPWEKSPAKHCLATSASFKRVTSIVRSGSHLVRNIS